MAPSLLHCSFLVGMQDAYWSEEVYNQVLVRVDAVSFTKTLTPFCSIRCVQSNGRMEEAGSITILRRIRLHLPAQDLLTVGAIAAALLEPAGGARLHGDHALVPGAGALRNVRLDHQ